MNLYYQNYHPLIQFSHHQIKLILLFLSLIFLLILLSLLQLNHAFLILYIYLRFTKFLYFFVKLFIIIKVLYFNKLL